MTEDDGNFLAKLILDDRYAPEILRRAALEVHPSTGQALLALADAIEKARIARDPQEVES